MFTAPRPPSETADKHILAVLSPVGNDHNTRDGLRVSADVIPNQKRNAEQTPSGLRPTGATPPGGNVWVKPSFAADFGRLFFPGSGPVVDLAQAAYVRVRKPQLPSRGGG